MVGGWLESDLCAELRARGRARPEMPFILRLGDSVVRGTIDLYSPGEVPLVVDYKTDAVGSQGLDEVVDRYGVQREIYALAAAQGGPRVRTAYVFLERPAEPVEVELDRAALDRVEPRARGADRRHTRRPLRGHRDAPRGALLGLPRARPPVLASARGDRPPASMRLAVFAYGSLVSAASAGRTLGRVVEPGAGARLEGWRRSWTLVRDNLALGEDVRPQGRHDSPFCLGLNVEPSAGDGPNGALIEVSGAELERLALREVRYDRVEVSEAIRVERTPAFDRVFTFTAKPENLAPAAPPER